MSNLDNYLNKKREEGQPTQDEAKKKRLFVPGLIIVIVGSFLNGLLIQAQIGGLIRESMRLVVWIGVIMILISIFRKFWKLVLTLSIIGLIALASWNAFGQKGFQESESSKSKHSFKVKDGKVVDEPGVDVPKANKVLQNMNQALSSLPNGTLDPYVSSSPQKELREINYEIDFPQGWSVDKSNVGTLSVKNTRVFKAQSPQDPNVFIQLTASDHSHNSSIRKVEDEVALLFSYMDKLTKYKVTDGPRFVELHDKEMYYFSVEVDMPGGGGRLQTVIRENYYFFMGHYTVVLSGAYPKNTPSSEISKITDSLKSFHWIS